MRNITLMLLLIGMMSLAMVGCSSEDADVQSPREIIQIQANNMFTNAKKVEIKPNNDVLVEYEINPTSNTFEFKNRLRTIETSSDMAISTIKANSRKIDVYVYKNTDNGRRRIYSITYDASKNDSVTKSKSDELQLEEAMMVNNLGLKYITYEDDNTTGADGSVGKIEFMMTEPPALNNYNAYTIKSYLLYHKQSIEEFMAKLIKQAFLIDPSAELLYIYAFADESDNRSGSDVDMVANITIDREQFEVYNENWDNLRVEIYDDIVYSPIFLMDYVTDVDIISLDYGPSTKITLFYDESYVSMKKSRSMVEKDARNIIYYLFWSYPEVSNINIVFKAKVPAENKETSVDGIHQILHEFLVVDADRSTYEDIVAENLNDQQYLFNFDTQWDAKALELNLKENMFKRPDKNTYRGIDFSDDKSAVVIDLDSCIIMNYADSTFKKTRDCMNLLKSGRACFKDFDEILNEDMADLAEKTMFDIHPPFLDRAEFVFHMVYRDMTGQETEVEDLGSISFDKQEEANYWFQTLKQEELVWVEEDDDNLDVDDDSVFCQI